MPRRARLDEKGFYYHIICRGQRKNPLFFSPDDRQKYFEILNEILREHDIGIYAYCLMSNHVHLLVKRNEHSLQSFMQRLNTRYAMYFNWHYNLVGHVFQDRYKSLIVLDEDYLLHLVKYIHLNPVGAKMCEEPSEYEYSSVSYYEGREEKNIAGLFKIHAFKKASEYIVFMDSDIDEYPTFKDSVGNEIQYVDCDKRKPGREKGKFEERRRVKGNAISRLDDVLTEIGLSQIELKRMKYSIEDRKRLKMVFRALIAAGLTRADIARVIGLNKSTVGRILKNDK